MHAKTLKIAQYGLLTALALVLGLLDRAIPLSAILSGMVPGIKLGLANTVLLYAIYLMDWESAVFLMLAKVLLSGFFFGSLQAIYISLSGGILSLLVMLIVRKYPTKGASGAFLLATAAETVMLARNPHPGGQQLLAVILIGIAMTASAVAWILIRKGIIRGVPATSIAGGIAHNIGQIIAAVIMLRTPALFTMYMPGLIGIGAVVGCLTGIIAERVFRALHLNPEKSEG